jgi:2-iminoacetate synthase
MTRTHEFKSFELRSDDSWNLLCKVESVGPDLLCRIHGGDTHIGVIALSDWRQGRARTDRLVSEGHREGGIATHAAHSLCAASRRPVVCVCGIHFDGINKVEIDEISQSAHELARKAARMVEDRRFKADTASSDMLARIEDGAAKVVHDVKAFVATSWATLKKRHGPTVAESFAKNFHDKVSIFAPLYLSNACLNNCVYCGFRRSVRFKRTTLSVNDSIREAVYLADQGFRVLDLVTGEVPSDRFIDYVCEVSRAILGKTAISALNLNLGSLSYEQYRRLREAGATGYHLYQESYDPEVYFGVHESGQKRDMASRLTGLHRAIEAGFEKVGLGVLLGLGAPAAELSRMIAHAEIIRNDFPHVKLGFSLPRIQRVDKQCSYVPESSISDSAFMKYMLFLRLHFPDAHLTLTTRERPEVRDTLLPLGITKVSAGVSTAPGGYTHSAKTEAGQFAISDERTLDEMRKLVESSHRNPVLE